MIKISKLLIGFRNFITGKAEKLKKIFSREAMSSLPFLPKALTKFDQLAILILAVLLFVSTFFIWWGHWLKSTKEVPAYGGNFVEAVVGEPKDLERHMIRLTNAGLTRLNEDGSITGDIAEKWEIVDDGKTYKFTLKEGFNSYDLDSYLKQKNIWPNIETETPADNVIAFKFKQPFSPFLYTSTQPVFPYGPYKIMREEKTRITLQPREDYWRGKPHVSKLVLALYRDEDTVKKAMHRGEVDGYFSKNKDIAQNEPFSTYEMSLPRELILFFNLNKPDLQSTDLRKKLKENQPIDKDLKLTLVTSDKEKNIKMAQEIKDKWKGLRVEVEVKKFDNITLQKDVIPKRDYDILLYGLDYGPDPDPYPFWHSSQNKSDGMNLSSFSNKKADKLLEEARQTHDFKVRDEKYGQFREIVNQEVPAIVMDKEVCYYAVSKDIKGLSKIYGNNESDRFLNVDDWYKEVKRVKK